MLTWAEVVYKISQAVCVYGWSYLIFKSLARGEMVEYVGAYHTWVCPVYLSCLFTPNLHSVTEFILSFASGPSMIHPLCLKPSPRHPQTLSLLVDHSRCKAFAFHFCKRFRLKSTQDGSGLAAAVPAVPSPPSWSWNWKNFLTWCITV